MSGRPDLRRLVPAATVVAGSGLMLLPVPLADGALPNAALLMLILWASLGPRLMPAWAAFLLGFVHDALAGLPMGVSGLAFPAAVALVRLGERRFGVQAFGAEWLFAAAVITAVHLLQWQLLVLLGWPVPAAPMLLQAGLTALAWPLAVAAGARLHRRLAHPGG